MMTYRIRKSRLLEIINQYFDLYNTRPATWENNPAWYVRAFVSWENCKGIPLSLQDMEFFCLPKSNRTIRQNLAVAKAESSFSFYAVTLAFRAYLSNPNESLRKIRSKIILFINSNYPTEKVTLRF